jgi:signal transduction histidine kinase
MFKYQSGRVIALGRVILAALFLVSIWLDQSQPAQSPERTYALLFFYVLYALGIAALTWRNWWLDARLAAPAHIIDMAVFTAIVFSTNGYTSPFFLFFVLPLLSAAIRWGWRETALTATLLVLLYLSAGLLVTGSETFELQRFVARSGHLVILSALLIWFGMHQQFTRLFIGPDELDRSLGRDEDPVVQALRLAMEAAHAGCGALVLGEERPVGMCLIGGAARPLRLDGALVHDPAVALALFDIDADRAVTRRSDRRYRFLKSSRLLDIDASREIGAAQGLISAVRTGTEQGWLVLWDIPDLSLDFLELGDELGRAAGAVLDREALLLAIEQGAAARTRLSLARDVHDSVVQFLAGAAFRVEAMMRGSSAGAQVESDLKELKRLLIEEQGEIRSFISALRRDRELELAEAVEELKALASRLSRQWSVDCEVTATEKAASVPIRLQLDLQHLLREAVANAVRHGGANRIHVEVDIEDDRLQLLVKDNGSGFAAANGEPPTEPWSLKERVERAHGSLSLFSEPGCTDIVITLPLAGAPA